MKAWVLHDIGQFTYEDTDIPKPEDGEALVKVGATGICGSDIPRVYREGAHVMPLIIGHEFAGVVEAVGCKEDALWLGKQVGIFPLLPCMQCEPCRKKQYEMCKTYSYFGSRQNGAFAEYVSVPLWNLIELPDGVSLEAAAMLEPMSVAVHAMRRTKPDANDKVVVWGLGTIGLFMAMFLLESGVRNLYVVGNKEFQRQQAKLLGIPDERYFDGSSKTCVEEIGKALGEGADTVFECVGKNATYEAVIDIAAPGGRVCLVGNPYGDMTLSQKSYWKILRRQLQLIGTWNSSYTHEDTDDWHYVLGRLASGRIHPEHFITHRFPLAEIDKGFALMRDKTEDYAKVMAVQE